MKYLLVKDKKKRVSVKKQELKRLVLKSINYNLGLNKSLREYAWFSLNNLEKNYIPLTHKFWLKGK